MRQPRLLRPQIVAACAILAGIAILATLAAMRITKDAEAGVPASQIELLIDCNSSTAAIDANCVYPDGTTAVQVAVVLRNNGPETSLGAFNFSVRSEMRGVFTPNTVSCSGPRFFDCNPDFNQVAVATSGDWFCGPPQPDPDAEFDQDPTTSHSFLSCFEGTASGPALLSGTDYILGTIDFTATEDFLSTLVLREVSLFTHDYADLGSCEPVQIEVPLTCTGATIQGGSNPPTPTATFTPTGSATPTLTPTSTSTIPPTPSGTPTGAVSEVIGVQTGVCIAGAAALAEVSPVVAALSCSEPDRQPTMQRFIECLHRRPFCDAAPFAFDVYQRIDPVDLAILDERDGDQLHAGQVFVIGAFVDGDYPVLFQADTGTFLDANSQPAGTSMLCYLDTFQFESVPGTIGDPDCDANPATQGDGFVAVSLRLNDTDPRGPGVVNASQGGVSSTFNFDVVGPPVEIVVSSLDSSTSIATGALPRTTFGHAPLTDACDFKTDGPFTGSTSSKKTDVLVRALDSDGVAVVSGVRWLVAGGTPFDSAAFGVLPEGGVAAPQHPLWNLGADGIGFVQTICGGTTPGTLNMDMRFDGIFDSGSPQQYVLPYSIDVTQGTIPLTAACLGADVDCDGIEDDIDNCMDVPNPGQENSDRNFIDNSPPFVQRLDDVTRIVSDDLGDACDSDDDNDRRFDIHEINENLCPQAGGPTDPLKGDTDGDGFLDSAECGSSSDPSSAASTPRFTDCGPPGFGDLGLTYRIEYCRFNSSPFDSDTDGDNSPDVCEVASLNGDIVVNSMDQGMLGAAIAGAVPYHANIDINKDGLINSMDQGIQAQVLVPVFVPGLGNRHFCAPPPLD